jgi:hypothetical protein
MKRVVLNRKNSLFVGNDRGGTAAILTSTCRRHDLDPQIYLPQLLVLPTVRISDLPSWLPDRWKAAHKARLLPCKINLRILDPPCGSRNAHISPAASAFTTGMQAKCAFVYRIQAL